MYFERHESDDNDDCNDSDAVDDDDEDSEDEERAAMSLYMAASIGSGDEVLEKMMERALKKINVDYRFENGLTALMVAGKGGHLDMVRLLLQRGADSNTKTGSGKSRLQTAAFNCHLSMARLLLGNGADPNAKDNEGWTALMIAAQKGCQDIVRLLLEMGAELEASNNYGATAFTTAAKNGQLDVTKLLIQRGAKVNAKNNHGKTALDLAMEMRSTDSWKVVQLLFAEGVDYDEAIVGKVLAFANDSHSQFTKGRGLVLDMVKLLIQNDADVWDGFPKFVADRMLCSDTINGKWDNVRCLLENGVNPNISDQLEGTTPLISAAYQGHLDTIMLLVEKGANLEAKDKMGATALDKAKQHDHTAIVALLERQVHLKAHCHSQAVDCKKQRID